MHLIGIDLRGEVLQDRLELLQEGISILTLQECKEELPQ